MKLLCLSDRYILEILVIIINVYFSYHIIIDQLCLFPQLSYLFLISLIALHEAVIGGHAEVVKYLLEHGANQAR